MPGSYLYIKGLSWKILFHFFKKKIYSIHYLYFPFEKHVTFQVLKDFSVENLKTTSSTFLSKFSFEIHVSRLINYWDSIFTLYATWLTLVCFFPPVFFFFFFFFYRYLPWQTLTIHRIAGKGEGITIFLFSTSNTSQNIHLVHRVFYHFFLIDLFVTARLIADKTYRFPFIHWRN